MMTIPSTQYLGLEGDTNHMMILEVEGWRNYSMECYSYLFCIISFAAYIFAEK
jgi:hypothetical protein